MPRIQHKRGTSANLASVNPTPLAGELVWDSTENAIKIGDGSTAWSSLAYVTATPRTHTHSADAITSGTIDYARLPVGSTSSTVCAGDDARLSDARTPTAHKASHATGGSDALTPSDIGAAPAASPAITGNATFSASSGVPVTITNTGTGNSFVVNDAAGDTTPFLIDASGNVGIGTAPAAPLEVRGVVAIRGSRDVQISAPGTGFGLHDFAARYDAATYIVGATIAALSEGAWSASSIPTALSFRTGGSTSGSVVERMLLGSASTVFNEAGQDVNFRVESDTKNHALFVQGSSGNVGIGATSPASALDVNGVITVAATSGSAGSFLPSVTISGDPNTGFGQVSGQSDSASVFTAGHERVRVKSTGAVRFVPLTADPGTADAGDVYYNSSTNKLRVYNGTSWVDLH